MSYFVITASTGRVLFTTRSLERANTESERYRTSIQVRTYLHFVTGTRPVCGEILP